MIPLSYNELNDTKIINENTKAMKTPIDKTTMYHIHTFIIVAVIASAATIAVVLSL